MAYRAQTMVDNSGQTNQLALQIFFLAFDERMADDFLWFHLKEFPTYMVPYKIVGLY